MRKIKIAMKVTTKMERAMKWFTSLREERMLSVNFEMSN